MDKKLIEVFQIRYGWDDQAILSISKDDAIHKMTKDEFDIYLTRMQEIAPKKSKMNIKYFDVQDGEIIVDDPEDWDG